MPLYIIRQDITKVQCDAIVNTTNRKLIGYSGVDGLIHTIAGPELDEECRKIYPLGLGCAKLTNAYNLPAKYVIHTSGPVWRDGLSGEKILLTSCYLESLKLAKKYNCETVAFPLISSGAYGYPKDQVLKQAVAVISDFLSDNEMTVYLCVYDKTSYEFSKELYKNIYDFINGKGEQIKGKRLAAPMDICGEDKAPSLKDYVKDLDKPFMDTLYDYMDRKGMSEVKCYKKANVDKKTFSKLRCNPNQKPSKKTAVAFAIALQLSIDETQHLLSTAGLTLSKSDVFDKIIRYFIESGNYDVYEINEALFEFDQVLLGSM